MSGAIFHLAIPTSDLDEAVWFYQEKLGCALKRRYEDRVTFEFFGHQVVCHLSPENIDSEPHMYPRHFGLTFLQKEDFDQVWKTARQRGVRVFREPFVRFEGMREEHYAFFLVDPSNNLIEFKWYRERSMIY